MPVDFVEARVRAAADKPSPMRRMRGIKSRRPRRKIGGNISGQHVSGLRVPARPTPVVATTQPSARCTDAYNEPVNRACSDIAMKCSGVSENRRPHRVPVITRHNRINEGGGVSIRNWRSKHVRIISPLY